jgi:acyl-CoA oxidase
MAPTPSWVEGLKPSGPQGSELLQQERDKSNVSADKLSELLHTKEVLERQERILAILESEEVFNKSQNHSMGRPERLKRSLAKAKRLRQLTEKYGWSEDDFAMANDLISEPTPYALHTSMFLVSFPMSSYGGS